MWGTGLPIFVDICNLRTFIPNNNPKSLGITIITTHRCDLMLFCVGGSESEHQHASHYFTVHSFITASLLQSILKKKRFFKFINLEERYGKIHKIKKNLNAILLL